ncbi:MAG TPA: LTA synthase family protein, partial [Chitinophaga sp.]
MKSVKNRYAVLFGFGTLLLVLSFLVRTALLIWIYPQSGLHISDIPAIYGKGLVYDIGVALFFTIAYAFYLLILPQRLNNTLFNRIFTYFGFFLTMMILVFSFFAEFTFWGEYAGRFDFIAVDYLIYTYEVIGNINESYPLPLLIGGVLLFTFLLTWSLGRKGTFRNSFQSNTSWGRRAFTFATLLGLLLLHVFFISNTWAEKSKNRYAQELSKAGVYSFFSAFQNNELAYDKYYLQEDSNKAFDRMRTLLQSPDSRYLGNGN